MRHPTETESPQLRTRMMRAGSHDLAKEAHNCFSPNLQPPRGSLLVIPRWSLVVRLAVVRVGSLARWLVGSLACWLVGSLARWLVGSLARWLVGSLARSVDGWLFGSLVAGSLVVRRRVVGSLGGCTNNSGRPGFWGNTLQTIEVQEPGNSGLLCHEA